MNPISFSKCAIVAAVFIAILADVAEAKDPVATTPVAATWKFSTDKGKTYTLDALPDIKPNTKAPVRGRGRFTIDDPTGIGALWFSTADEAGGICPLNAFRIGHRYISMPLILLEAVVELNGRAVPFEMNDLLTRRVAIAPSMVRAGTNEIVFHGNCWNSMHNSRATAESPVAFRVMTSPPDALALRNGPVLGPIGTNFFTLACRTWVPAALQVSVKPLAPAGAVKSFDFPRSTLHRARMDLPRGTRVFEYTVTAVNGDCRTAAGPWKVRVPDPAKGLRFIVMGQTAAHVPDKLYEAAAALKKADPDFIIHAGSLIICTYWSFAWDSMFFEPFREVLATKPILIVPAYRDLYSMAFGRLFYYPTQNGAWDQWTWSLGPVRFIGIDGLTCAQYAEPVAKWFEGLLSGSSEDFLFQVTAYPGYTSNKFGRGIKGHDYDEKVLHPLLAKYKATASFGCSGRYDFVPARNDRAVPTFITGGVGAPMSSGWNKYQYCIVEIKDGKCTVQAMAYETGEVLDTRTFEARKNEGAK